MPRHCVTAGCDSISGKGYSFHKFPKDEIMQRSWINAVKRQQSSWNGPSVGSQLCSSHFESDCFITEEVCFHDEMGIPTVKHLKPDAVLTIFARSVNYLQASSNQCSTPTTQLLSERRHQRSVRQFSIKLQACIGQ